MNVYVLVCMYVYVYVLVCTCEYICNTYVYTLVVHMYVRTYTLKVFPSYRLLFWLFSFLRLLTSL